MNREEFYNALSEDVKNKIKACKTEEEMLKVLSQEGIALDDELLDSVSGGGGILCDTYLFDCLNDPSDGSSRNC